jgi:hypothetical protein
MAGSRPVQAARTPRGVPTQAVTSASVPAPPAAFWRGLAYGLAFTVPFWLVAGYYAWLVLA